MSIPLSFLYAHTATFTFYIELASCALLLQEICVGILGNMACNSDACQQISENKQLV